jgi:hypothetical protein
LIEPAKELPKTTRTGISKPLSQPLLKFEIHFYNVFAVYGNKADISIRAIRNNANNYSEKADSFKRPTVLKGKDN